MIELANLNWIQPKFFPVFHTSSSHPKYCIQLQAPHFKKCMDKFELVQKKVMKIIRMDILILVKRRLKGNMVLFSEHLKGFHLREGKGLLAAAPEISTMLRRIEFS